MKPDIYKMGLHGEVDIHRNYRVVRVPGGWIYHADNEQVGGTWQTVATFVPYNEEFKG